MADAQELVKDIEALSEKLNAARNSIGQQIIGQQDVVDLSLVAMLSGGHALLMGLPGLGKTLLVDTLPVPLITDIIQRILVLLYLYAGWPMSCLVGLNSESDKDYSIICMQRESGLVLCHRRHIVV